jgi:hypothetical protein
MRAPRMEKLTDSTEGEVSVSHKLEREGRLSELRGEAPRLSSAAVRAQPLRSAAVT